LAAGVFGDSVAVAILPAGGAQFASGALEVVWKAFDRREPGDGGRGDQPEGDVLIAAADLADDRLLVHSHGEGAPDGGIVEGIFASVHEAGRAVEVPEVRPERGV